MVGESALLGKRVLLHDYGRFPFIMQLARKLADRGHKVCYVCSAAVPKRAALELTPREAANLEVVSIPVAGVLSKQAFIRRRKQEIAHGKDLEKIAERFAPDVVVSANTPLDAQSALVGWCREHEVEIVYWLQDLYGIAIKELLKQKLPIAGAPIAQHYMRMERRLLAQSDAVVIITEDFRPHVEQLGIRNGKVHRLENWAPVAEIPVKSKVNPWSLAHGLADKQVFLYSGTMGMKHDPHRIVDLAVSMRHEPDARVVVVSEGSAIGWLKQQQTELKLENLIILPMQTQADLPNVLATADVLVAILHKKAGVFSVPSKVLTYMCAGRAVLLAVPKENLVARVVMENNAGLVVDPDDSATFVEAADCLLHERDFREYCGKNARRYADTHFDIDLITDHFERVLFGLSRRAPVQARVQQEATFSVR